MTMLTRLRTTTLLTFLLLVANPVAAEPDRKGGARILYQDGMSLYEHGQYREAILKFEAAHALHPHLNNVYYMAEAFRRLGQLRKSHEYYSRYAAMLSGANQADFQVKLKKLRYERDCMLSVASQPGGGDVSIDGARVAETPKDGTPVTFTIKGGAHDMEIRLVGYRPVVRKVEAQFGEPIALSLALKQRSNTGVLRVETNVEGALVIIDGKTVGTTPAVVEAKAGQRLVVITQNGYRREERKVTITEGKDTRLLVELRRGASEDLSPRGAVAPAPEDTPLPDHGGPFIFLHAAAAFPDYGDEALKVGAAVVAGASGGYLMQWGRLGLELGVQVLASPVTYKTQDESAWFLSYMAGPGLRFYFLNNLWAGVTIYAGGSTLVGATEKSFLFRDCQAEVSGAYTLFILRPELTLGWHVWKGLTLALTAFSLDYSPPHGDFVESVQHVIRYQVGGAAGWSF